MCIIFFGKNKDGLFITFNRDEYLSRPTERFSKINKSLKENENFDEDIYYSLDTLTNGTFFAINKRTHNFCFLLNHAFLNHTYIANVKRKRGHLPLEYCSLKVNSENSSKDSIDKEVFDDSNKEYLNNLIKQDEDYNGYNLICGNLNLERVFYYTNNKELYFEDKITKSKKLNYELPYEFEITNGSVYGVSNLALFECFNKVDSGIKQIKEIVNKNYDINNNEFSNEICKVMFDDKVYINKPSTYDKILKDNYKKYCEKNQVDNISNPKEEDCIYLIEINKIPIEIKYCSISSIFVNCFYDNKVLLNYGTRQNYFIQYYNILNNDKEKKEISSKY